MDQPNFLIIMSDEHDPRLSEPYGHPFVRTPNMRRLAERGVVFDNGYCNSPLCVPSRASFMTGKHVHRIGVWDNGIPLASDEPTWAHRLNAVGYDTALAGKMHFIGKDQRHGFRRRLVEDVHGEFNMNPPDWDRTVTPGRQMRARFEEAGPGDSMHQQYDDEVTRQSVAYLAEPERKRRPWALVTSVITPHFPLIVRQQYYDDYYPAHADLPTTASPEHLTRLHPQNQRLRRYFDCEDVPEEQVRRCRATYYGLIAYCDERIGQVLDALEANGLAEDTVVAYVADHGEMNGEHGMWWKCTFYEPSARIPFVVSWPKRFARGHRRHATSLVDLVATMLDLAGAESADTDGTSLTRLLEGSQPDGDGLAIAEYEAHGTDRPSRMVRRGRWKLNYYFREPSELFDLEADPDELNDLTGDPVHAAVRDELTAIALDGWDPAEIDRRVRESQRKRRILVAGDPGPPSHEWDPATVGMAVGPVEGR
jgi:choline-sulfatase